MTKLKIALYFSSAFSSPHNNKNRICAPMTLIEDIAQGLYNRGHEIYFIVPKNSKNKPYYYRTPIFSSLSEDKDLVKLAKDGNRIERSKLLLLYNQSIIQEFLSKKNKIDIFHFHNPEYAVPILAKKNLDFTPIMTFHDVATKGYYKKIIDLAEKVGLKTYYSFLSNRQKLLLKTKNSFVVNNAIQLSNYPFTEEYNDFMSFSGRMIESKGIIEALKISKKLNKELKAAGSIPQAPDELAFWNEKIKPLFDSNKNAEYLGLLPYDKIHTLYKNSKLFLFPIKWEEAFGLVMIESMACGTPVVAFNRGSVPEVVKNGVTGYIVKTEKEMIEAVKKIYAMPKDEYMAMRRACRKHVEDNFTVERMVDNYEKLYYKIIEENKGY